MKFRPQENEFFYFISDPNTIADLQVPETLYYITRGANWSDVKKCFSAPKIAKNENQMKHKNQMRNRILIESYVFEDEGLYLSLIG